ncbi:diacylglycerol kinase family lipid kinase [Nitratireductor aquimarinus]|uniref:Diacylglycerol kinase family lipid kinase n=1 Tax=Nitratireductor aquimarinus TaxID=889300 RepID=A0ABU4AHP7_9HYPH|nr:diacylglycerol kinase family lipid kinase [Nitratireductor aquimarinus]MDV6225754.1 diacylglycerol kinase family lipid kinase [Nitratireductor aquimarinus]
MHVLAVLNCNGGTLRSLDTEALAREMKGIFEAADHTIDISLCRGDELVATMEDAARDETADIILAGGGDGTISLAAGLLAHSDKALAILPAGTMNLFARSLAIPQDLRMAMEALAHGDIKNVDIADADGHYFVHQLSIGMHPKLIRLRERMTFRSRIGKIFASVRAAMATMIRPPKLEVELELSETKVRTTTSNLAITNNLYAEGQRLPFTDQPDGGQLGVYITHARTRTELILWLLNMGIGRWRQNEQMEIHEATDVTVRICSRRRRFKCAIDGELRPLQRETRIRLHPGALSVVMPRPADQSL